MPSSRAALTFVLLSVFIDSLGFGIIIPSLPSVIMELTGEAESHAAVWSGYLMAVYALLQFFLAPIFGNLSDRYGRRPILLMSLFAFGVDFLLTGLATSMTWLFIGRAFAGVFGASFATAGAYIGDISDDSNRAKHFGFIGAAWGGGFTLGPVIGGFVAEGFDPRAPFFVAAALALANVAFGYFALPESLPVDRRHLALTLCLACFPRANKAPIWSTSPRSSSAAPCVRSPGPTRALPRPKICVASASPSGLAATSLNCWRHWRNMRSTKMPMLNSCNSHST